MSEWRIKGRKNQQQEGSKNSLWLQQKLHRPYLPPQASPLRSQNWLSLLSAYLGPIPR